MDLPPTGQKTKQPKYFYGRTVADIEPIPPWQPGKYFNPHWGTFDTPSLWQKLPSILEPPPVTTPPPAGFEYPQAPPYHLLHSKQYLGNQVYVCDFDPNTKKATQEKMLKIIMPPGSGPVRDAQTQKPLLDENQNLTFQEVPGSVKAIDGVPMAARLNNDDNDLITICNVISSNSAPNYGDLGAEIIQGASTIQKLLWGTAEMEGKDGIVAQPGLQRNTRSAPEQPGRNDGSFNMASVSMNGNGQGKTLPATQVRNSLMDSLRAHLNTAVADVYEKVLKVSLTKAEFEALKFCLEDMNVLGLGGTVLFPTSIQLNLASLFNGEDLAKAIGFLQGKWHVDKGDDPASWTVLFLFVRLPEGLKLLFLPVFSLTDFRL
jgi:hypothetical protein